MKRLETLCWRGKNLMIWERCPKLSVHKVELESYDSTAVTLAPSLGGAAISGYEDGTPHEEQQP